MNDEVWNMVTDYGDAYETFLAECDEMLGEMEVLLLELESSGGDPEKLNTLFRCVHTIKGSAGLFDLQEVVRFTHVLENVLDRLRAQEITADESLIALLLKCRDQIQVLIDHQDQDLPDEVQSTSQTLQDQLSQYQNTKPQKSGKGKKAESTENKGNDQPTEEATPNEPDIWHISLRFNPDVMRHGMDPAGFIQYLEKLGEIQFLEPMADSLPAPEDYDPEVLYLGFEIELKANTTKAAIEEVFEFVLDECTLKIVPPGSTVEEYLEAIAELPEEDTRLGEILIASGAITATELNAALEQQKDTNSPDKRIGEVLVEEGAVQPEALGAAVAKQHQGRGKGSARAAADKGIRIQADKLDRLINQVGELVIASAAAGLAARHNGDAGTEEAVHNITNLVEEIRNSALNLRMVAIGETFQRFQRVVRDVSKELDKDISLEINGAETELDKTVVEQIADPLTHLVRNAMDHGIESGAERKAAGKSPAGKVGLNAYHEAGSIVIEVSDDGGGLPRDKILDKALSQGLISASDEISDHEVFQLIFEPGFSTAGKVSNLSGRGVGMDVVKRNIERLRGSVEVASIEGRGTTIRIRLPLTLAIIDGFLTGVGEENYVIPLESVVECVELTAEQHNEIARRHIVNLRGEALPIIHLRDYFALDSEAGSRENIVVVKYGSNKAGLIVDQLMGEHQTVIKPLGKLFASLKGISGSTILGNGGVALILDVPSLVQRASKQEHAHVGK